MHIHSDYEASKVNGYATVQEAAEKWCLPPRQVQILCEENRIAGVSRMSRIWIIPENDEKPTSDKRGQGRERNDSSEHHVSKTEYWPIFRPLEDA
jgi:hypothetical protein